MSEVNEPQLAALKEMNRWLRLLARPRLDECLSQGIRTSEDYALFQKSDGRSTRDVARATSVSDKTVRSRWAAWVRLGIVEETETAGRFKKILDLSDVGFERPDA